MTVVPTVGEVVAGTVFSWTAVGEGEEGAAAAVQLQSAWLTTYMDQKMTSR